MLSAAEPEAADTAAFLGWIEPLLPSAYRLAHAMGGPNGQRLVIHDGVVGGPDDFDPTAFFPDGDRLWAANYDGTAIWLWTERDGLKRFPLRGLPQHDPFVMPQVAGPCA